MTETVSPEMVERDDVLATYAATTFRKLSDPQRLMLAEQVRPIGNPERFVLCGDRVFSAANGPTRNVLKKKGLVELTKFGPMTLTTLGLAVRTLATQGDR